MDDKITCIEWDDSYETGIARVDQQHKELMDKINELYKGMTLGIDKETQKKNLLEFQKFVAFHFETEEELFKKHSYPEAETHIHAHEKLLKEFQSFVKSYLEGTEDISEKLFDYIRTWLIDHVVEVDIPFGEYYLAKICPE